MVYILIIISEVTKVDIDMEGQKVFIESTLSSEDLLATLKKTGRECSYVGVKQWAQVGSVINTKSYRLAFWHAALIWSECKS